MKYIGVFCSANNLEEKYTKPAKKFATLIAENGYSLVWGGSDTGLMNVIASTVQEGGGKLIGVTFAVFQHKARKNADEMILASSLGERKLTMLNRSDAIVVLPGGIGTLDELAEMLELKKEGKHNKPVIVLNTDNFYTGLKMQLQKMKDEGFIAPSLELKNNILTQPLDEFIYFAEQPQEAIAYINKLLDS